MKRFIAVLTVIALVQPSFSALAVAYPNVMHAIKVQNVDLIQYNNNSWQQQQYRQQQYQDQQRQQQQFQQQQRQQQIQQQQFQQQQIQQQRQQQLRQDQARQQQQQQQAERQRQDQFRRAQTSQSAQPRPSPSPYGSSGRASPYGMPGRFVTTKQRSFQGLVPQGWARSNSVRPGSPSLNLAQSRPPIAAQTGAASLARFQGRTPTLSALSSTSRSALLSGASRVGLSGNGSTIQQRGFAQSAFQRSAIARPLETGPSATKPHESSNSNSQRSRSAQAIVVAGKGVLVLSGVSYTAGAVGASNVQKLLYLDKSQSRVAMLNGYLSEQKVRFTGLRAANTNLDRWKSRSASSVNAEMLKLQGEKIPYRNVEGRISKVYHARTYKTEQFVRVYSSLTKPNGRWLMRKKDIEGLSAEQIADKFALPHVPTDVIDVAIPPGKVLRYGIAGENFSKKGGGMQYELIEEVELSAFSNMRPIGHL